MDGIELMTQQNWKLRGAMAAGVGAAGGACFSGQSDRLWEYGHKTP